MIHPDDATLQLLAIARNRQLSRSERENLASMIEDVYGANPATVAEATARILAPPARPHSQHRAKGRAPRHRRRPS